MNDACLSKRNACARKGGQLGRLDPPPPPPSPLHRRRRPCPRRRHSLASNAPVARRAACRTKRRLLAAPAFSGRLARLL
eukprot:2851367-Pleurochrysis_carterae.AAC.1